MRRCRKNTEQICVEEQQKDVEGENVEGMAEDSLSKQVNFTESELPLSDCLQWSSHPAAATVGRQEGHCLGSKKQQIKAIKHSAAVLCATIPSLKTLGGTVCNL